MHTKKLEVWYWEAANETTIFYMDCWEDIQNFKIIKFNLCTRNNTTIVKNIMVVHVLLIL